MELTEVEKTAIRRAYIRGTLHDCFIKGKNIEEYLRIIATTIITASNSLQITVFPLAESEVMNIDCGTIVPSDYSDDTPSPDIQ